MLLSPLVIFCKAIVNDDKDFHSYGSQNTTTKYISVSRQNLP